ncbi:hypothetical protein GOQ29_04775 [Clostridium sp. D2Q-14]|uniref:lysine 5,6-aminomutase reactivase subunit KamB n=1 Tax=Anaeromonas gelatinilytica TaxID=2683194 RepID=UPI00193C5648|nr:hypothetical protein [Anaeromonas gelatinilytica]MBS4534929.1 hypothetical protein [Anaeromonas gelatinilytica]
MELVDLVHQKCKIVSIIGMAKNAGKTVTLNRIIEDSYDRDINLGITSTGRDGERIDVLTNTEKPAIYAFEGNIIATTTGSIEISDATIEIIEITDYRSPMGKIVLGRVIDGGYIEIAGPQTIKEMKVISDRILQLGADLVLVDGSINRIAVADPNITDGAVLATGAVLSRSMDKVIEETLHQKTLLGLPEVEEDLKGILIDNTRDISIIDKDFNINRLNIKTSINSGKVIADNIDENSKYVFMTGSLVTKTLKDITEYSKLYKDVTIVVPDGTKIFVGPKDWLKFKKKGVKIKVLNTINVIAITLNPYSPLGYYFNPEEFKEKMSNYIKDLPVFDVMI